jgi:DHA1 family multidrug resistance protein-like MFS transporter
LRKITFPQITDIGVLSIAISQFGMTFSNNFIMVFMPFYILKISPLSHQATMLWIGMIMGGASIATTLAAPFWGGLTARMSPKFLYERAMFCSAVIILLMGFADNIYMLFVLRVIGGAVGGASTIGLILTSALSPPEKIRGNMSLFQNSITAGQLLGPPSGAFAAGLLGYHFPFYIASAMIFTFLIFCHFHVRHIPPQGEHPRTGASLKKSLLFGWFLCMIGTVNLTFLPSIMPHITGTFHMSEKEGLGAAGIIMMTYTGSSIFGSYVLCRLSARIGLTRIMTTALLMAAVFQVLMVFSRGAVSFAVLRMLQCAFIAAVFPLTISIFARQVSGRMIGFLNAARFFGNAVGPLLATSILAYADLLTLYLVIAGLTLCSLWFFLTSMQTEEEI